jgi:hypothetical protein
MAGILSADYILKQILAFYPYKLGHMFLMPPFAEVNLVQILTYKKDYENNFIKGRRQKMYSVVPGNRYDSECFSGAGSGKIFY